MRYLKLLVVAASGAYANNYLGSNLACGSPSTIYVTVPASATTRTIYAIDHGSPAKFSEGSLTLTTETVTYRVATTQTITLLEASRSPATTVSGPYSFIANAGKTIWLGDKTPPASSPLDIATSYVTLQPLPVTNNLTSQASEFSMLDLSTHSVRRAEYSLTAASTGAVTAIPASGNAYTGLGKAGWNATTFATMMSGSRPLAKPASNTDRYDKHASADRLADPKDRPTGDVHSRLLVRDVGDVVVATIDGATMSWANNFNGATPSSRTTVSLTSRSSPISVTEVTSEASVLAPSVTVAIYPWDLRAPNGPAPTSSIMSAVALPTVSDAGSAVSRSSESHSSTPSTMVGIYPWDVNIPNGPASSTSTVSKIATWMWSGAGSAILSSSESHSLFPSPSTTVGIYSWNLVPESSPTSTSISSVGIDSGLSTNSSNTPSTVIAQPSSCSSFSPYFTVTFDDLPQLDISSDPTNTDTPPILNPYRKLYWEGHFGYVPPPSDPYPPKSSLQLAVYRADNTRNNINNNNNNITISPDAGLEQAGELGAGPRASHSAYWFNAHSMWIGCSDGSNHTCHITIDGIHTGLSSSDARTTTTTTTTKTTTQTFEAPPCPGLKGCSLSFVAFTDDMVDLTGLQIRASVGGGKAVDYYMDDLVLSWSDDTCAAQWERASAE